MTEPLDVDVVLASRPELPITAVRQVVSAPSIVRPRTDEPESLTKITMSTRKRRATAYAARAEPSIDGQGGHPTAMRVATAVVRGFALDHAAAREVLDGWNARCLPPWSGAQIDHKIQEAMRVGALPWGKMLLTDLEPEAEPESEGGAARARARKVATQLWEVRLLKDKKGNKRVLANVMLILSHADEWCEAIAWDEFAERIVITKTCPAGPVGPWSDVADSLTAEWIQQSRWHVDAGPELVAAAVRAVADRQRIHPVRDWLSALTWDGVARIDTWLIRYLGVEDTPYARAVGRRFLVSAVARTFRPGCQVDTMLILEGDQGLRKSSALRVLAGDDWFLETQVDLRDPNACHALRRRWVVEFSELAALKGSDVERVKSFVSTRVDSYRPPYGRHVLDHPRQCVLVGSTNARQYLRDETGARRFWPVRVTLVDLAKLAEDREQLWAEARVAFEAGEAWYLDSAELHDAASEEQEERRSVDPWEESIRDYLNSPSRQNGGIGIQDIMGECLRIEIHNRSRGDEMRIGGVLTKLGWERKRVRFASSLTYRYFKRAGRHGRDGSGNTESSMIPDALPTVPTVPTINTHDINTLDNSVGPQRELEGSEGSEGTGGTGWWETEG